ncbi:ankyrin repeat domain-containing protein [bacterium]|nr:ankyrin repeat domain-containing protein [bacterium]
MKQLLITIAAVLVVGCGPKAPDISIHDAAIDGNIAAVKQCIAAGWGIDAKIGGWTALHHAANVGNKEIVELLIANGADVNAKDDNLTLWTPLHKAASRGHNAIVEILLSRSANVNAKDGSGRSPLDWAVLNDHTETADLLRKHGGKTGDELKAEGK